MENQNIFNKIKTALSNFISKKSSKKRLNEFEEIKRNILIKKMNSNAIAIVTNQIELQSGCEKMVHLTEKINEIQILDTINLEIFKTFCREVKSYPIIEKRNHFKKEYLEKIDLELKLIDEKYNKEIKVKCLELIEKHKQKTSKNDTF